MTATAEQGRYYIEHILYKNEWGCRRRLYENIRAPTEQWQYFLTKTNAFGPNTTKKTAATIRDDTI